MATIRNVFHELGNWHNKISIIAGVTRELLTETEITTLTISEIKEKISKVIKGLNQIEQNALSVDKVVNELKEAIYKKISPDTEVSSNRKQGEK